MLSQFKFTTTSETSLNLIPNKQFPLASSQEPKIVLITGGTSGIGLELVEQYAKRKDTIVYTFSSTKEKVETTQAKFAKQQNVSVNQIDIRENHILKEYVRMIIEKHNHIDVLINNAAVPGQFEHFGSTDSNKNRETFEVNYEGPMELCHLIVPFMQQRGCGTIVNVTSMAAGGVEGAASYSASKAALDSFTFSIQKENPALNIFAFDPEAVLTPMLILVSKGNEAACPQVVAVKKLIDSKQARHPEEVASGLIFVLDHPEFFREIYKGKIFKYTEAKNIQIPFMALETRFMALETRYDNLRAENMALKQQMSSLVGQRLEAQQENQRLPFQNNLLSQAQSLLSKKEGDVVKDSEVSAYEITDNSSITETYPRSRMGSIEFSSPPLSNLRADGVLPSRTEDLLPAPPQLFTAMIKKDFIGLNFLRELGRSDNTYTLSVSSYPVKRTSSDGILYDSQSPFKKQRSERSLK